MKVILNHLIFENILNPKNTLLNEKQIDNKEYLNYFYENNMDIKNISHLGSGENSKTFLVKTNKADYALNVRNEKADYYSILIDRYYEYLPIVYDVKTVDNKSCIVMEVLNELSDDKKEIINVIDYLFYANDEDGLDIWLEDNLHTGLLSKIKELLHEIDIDDISEKQYISKITWFLENYLDYKKFINEIENAFIEYNQVFGMKYVDFHGDNIMTDHYGQLKLIDL